MVDNFGDRADPHTRQRLAQLYIGDRIRHLLVERWKASLQAGATPGPKMSILKLHSCRNNAVTVAMLTEVLGSRLAADAGDWGTFAWNDYVLSTPGTRIGGGTEEIVRNTVGEKVLGLPKEPARLDERRPYPLADALERERGGGEVEVDEAVRLAGVTDLVDRDPVVAQTGRVRPVLVAQHVAPAQHHDRGREPRAGSARSGGRRRDRRRGRAHRCTRPSTSPRARAR